MPGSIGGHLGYELTSRVAPCRLQVLFVGAASGTFLDTSGGGSEVAFRIAADRKSAVLACPDGPRRIDLEGSASDACGLRVTACDEGPCRP